MSVRQDSVQIRIDFITDESKAFAKTILATKGFNKEIDDSRAKIVQYEKELKKANITEDERAKKLAAIAVEQTKIGINQAKIVAAAKETAKIDLSKLTPAQLVERAKQLELAMRHIASTHPEFKQLQAELSGVKGQLTEIRNTSKGISSGGGGFEGLLGIATKIAAAYAIVVTALRAVGSAINGSAKLEQLNIAFETFLGSASKAKQVVQDLRKFADVTPFETEPVNAAGRALLAFGFSASELIPTLTRVGNVASGTGKDFNELALIYGKAKAEGKIQGDTLNQLAEAGIPIYAELAKVLNVNEDQIRKLAETGRINFSDLQQVFVNLTSEGGRFNGLMEKQSQSLTGLFSTLASAVQNSLTAVADIFLPIIKAAVSFAIEAVVNIGLALVALPKFVVENRVAIGALIVAIATLNAGNIAAAASTLYVAASQRAAAIATTAQAVAQRILNAAMTANPIGLVIAAIAGLVAIFATAYEKSESFRASIAGLGNVAKELFTILQEAFSAFARGFKQIADGDFSGALKSFGEGITKSNPIGIAFTQGQRLGKAFGDGYNDSISAAKEQARAQLDLEDKIDQENDRRDYEAELKRKDKEAATLRRQKAEAAKKAQDEADKRLKAALDAALSKTESAAARREVVLEKFRLDGTIKEDRYQDGLIAIQKVKYQEQLDVFKLFHKEQSLEALKAQNKLLELEIQTTKPATKNFDPIAQRKPGAIQSNQVDANNTQKNLDIQDIGENALENELRRKFKAAIITEQEYNLQKISLQLLAVDQELAILRSAEKPELDIIKKKEEEKQKLQGKFDETSLANQKRLEDLKVGAQQKGLSATADVFAVAAELLSQDEKNKAKHASAIKAFQIAQVGTNLVAEVSSIFRNAQESIQSKALGPIAGNILAAVQAAIAGARAGIAIKKIQATKFAGGGYTGDGFGAPDETGFKVAGWVHEGEHVNPKWQVQDPVYGPVIRWLEAGRVNRLNGYAAGGDALPTINTTPFISPGLLSGASGGSADFSRFDATVTRFEQVVANFPTEVKSRVVYTEIEAAGDAITTVRDLASI